MYIIELTYTKPIEAVEALLAAHVQWLSQYYEKGIFIASGRKNPRSGGIIICKDMPLYEVEAIIKKDPFNAVADYRVINFTATMTSEKLEILKSL